MEENNSMLNDKREIQQVVNDFECVTMWAVGKCGVTKIECYGEPGEFCYIPFLAIYKGDTIVERANALRFHIYYKPEDK